MLKIIITLLLFTSAIQANIYRGEQLDHTFKPSELTQLKKETRIFLIRHAETEWNAKGLLQGWTDIPLNKLGKQQAKKVARSFAYLNLSAIYYSPLSRAKDSALAIAAYHPITTLIEDRSLRFYDPNVRLSTLRSQEEIEAEIAEQVTTGVTAYLKQVANDYPGQNVVIMTHGKVMKHLYASLTGRDVKSIKIDNSATVRVLATSDQLSLEQT